MVRNEDQTVTLTQEELSQIAGALQSRVHITHDMVCLISYRIADGRGDVHAPARLARKEADLKLCNDTLGKIERLRYRGPSLPKV